MPNKVGGGDHQRRHKQVIDQNLTPKFLQCRLFVLAVAEFMKRLNLQIHRLNRV